MMNAVERVVDVIVLVRRDVSAAKRCVASILASRNATKYAVIAVLDPEVEREFRASEGELADDARLMLVRTGRSLDYAGATNRGLSMHAERDVVLLQADAEVHGDWLDRLAAHADAGDAGIVGTFTNVAGSATYPRRESPSRGRGGRRAGRTLRRNEPRAVRRCARRVRSLRLRHAGVHWRDGRAAHRRDR